MKKEKEKLPLYSQIYNYYKEEIINKKIKEGSALPSERKLIDIFNVSRSTVRQALQALENDGLIYRIPGSGSFVSNQAFKQELSNFYSFYEEIKKIGKSASSKVLSYNIIPITNELKEIFKLGKSFSTSLLHIKRLRLVNSEPLIYEETFLPLSRFENFNVELLNEIPMYSIFKETYNVIFNKATETFSSLILEDKEILKHLGYHKSGACMFIKRLTYEKDSIIEYTISYARGDKYEYTVTLNNI